MRKHRARHLLAGAALALVAAAPGAKVLAAPDRVELVLPIPSEPNSRLPEPMRRESAPEQTPEAPAAEQPRTPAPAAPETRAAPDRPLTAGDTEISDKLRAIVTGKQFDKRVDHPAERKAIESFYAAHNYEPLWIRDGQLTGRARAVVERLKGAAVDGLDAADYPVPDFAGAGGADTLAGADIRLTYSMLTYARHLAAGRIAPTRVSAEVDYGNHTPDPADILKRVSEASDAGAALESYNPPHAGFKALRQMLAKLREAAKEPDNRIPDGHPIKPGAKDERIPQLRERLGLSGKPGDLTYDKALNRAVRILQDSADLKPTGVIDSKTIALINGPKKSQQIDHVLANMERWRWLPRDLGKTYVMVNIPNYTLDVVRDHKLAWHTKIVAGKPQTPTPLLTAAMDNVVVNPSWYVPQSIIQNELLPRYGSDPNIFDRMGLEVKRGPDGNINVVQPPGAANALGRIKFNFPNKFQVYLHDTPEKRLFAADKRAFSHGCMRVENPTKFGEVMLAMAIPGQTPNARQLSGMFGHDEHTFKMVNRPMVHLTYQTAFIEDGKLVLRDDIYGFDARIHAILHSDERRVADIAPPQDPKRELATLKANQEILRRVERREAHNPLQFFERLFR